MTHTVVREFARLTTDSSISQDLDQVFVSESAFEWLCQLSSTFKKSGASLLSIENRKWLRLDNFVGILETPCGTVIEILPKHIKASDDDESARKLLIKMLSVALDLPKRTTDKTDIKTFRHSLLEWVMKQFVDELDHLLKRGMRFDYHRIEDQQRFLRGRLDLNKQLRQAPGRDHIFNIRHDVFLADRPENRLLKTALVRVCKSTRQPDTWQLALKLQSLLSEIPLSQDLSSDFSQWRRDRLMAHYQPVRPFCELVLGNHMPLAMQGRTNGISMLFPMEKLFERYVELTLRKKLPAPLILKSQARSQWLCRHKDKNMFQLKPDLMIQIKTTPIVILDTKWKLISCDNPEKNYDLNQGDFYQMFAYGHKYLNGDGELILIYPKTEKFNTIKEFQLDTNMKLWVVPFDLEEDELKWPNSITQKLYS